MIRVDVGRSFNQSFESHVSFYLQKHLKDDHHKLGKLELEPVRKILLRID